jgi:hypothetical protein
MVCQAASATASLREVLKAGPLCLQRTLDPKKISVTALNSTRPGRGNSLILYLGAVVMPKCSSRAQSLPTRTGASAPKDSTSSTSRYIFSSSVSHGGGTPRWPHLLCPGPLAAAAPQQASPEPLGPQGPPALSQKAPPPVMRLEVRRAVPPEVVTHVEVPADQRVDGRCSCVRYGECKPSIIERERDEYETIKFYGAKKNRIRVR